MDSETEKKPFWFAKSIAEVRETISFDLAKHSKFDLN